MIKENTVDQNITKLLREANDLRDQNHKSSGKLSASKLSWPLQWQVLSSIGVESTPFDDYTLRRFKRGVEIEDWLVKYIPGVVEAQKFASYRDCIGFIDAYVDGSDYENPTGNIPHEIKSVTNQKYKWIVSKDEPDDAHVLQAGLYAIATKSPAFMIHYVASDDLRVSSFLMEVTSYLKQRIDKIIDDYQEAMQSRTVPVFEPLYDWQNKKMYNNYPEWSELTKEEIAEKVERLSIKF